MKNQKNAFFFELYQAEAFVSMLNVDSFMPPDSDVVFSRWLPI